MPRYFLTSLRIEGFRGINNEGDPLHLKFNKEKLNSVFALNGIGKSSIYDAVLYAITGNLPKIDKLHSIERSEDYYLNRFHTGSHGSIEITLLSDDSSPVEHKILIERLSNGSRRITSPSSHPNPQELLDSLNNSFALIDYHTFNDFISNSPLERGRSFSTLLGLDSYSYLRQSLRAVADTRAANTDYEITRLETGVSSDNDSKNTSLIKLGSSYKQVTTKDIDDTSKIQGYKIEVADTIKQVPLIAEIVKSHTLDEYDFDEILKKIKSAEGGADKDRHSLVVSQLSKLNPIKTPDESIETELEAFKTEVEELETLFTATAGLQRRSLYEKADHIVSSDDWHDKNKCPVCMSELGEPITDIVKSQLEQYKIVDEKINGIGKKWLASQLRSRILVLEDTVANDIPETERHFIDNDRLIQSGNIKPSDFSQLSEYYLKLETRLASGIDTFTKERNDLAAKLPASLVELTQKVEYVKQFKEDCDKYQNDINKFDKSKKKLDSRKKWHQFLIKASDVFASAEAGLSSNKLLSIETEYKAMFADVMGAGDVTPNLTRDNTSEQLYMELSEFRGQQDLAAKPLLSESYRNALAISVYLSAAMKHSDAPRFIVLDDISSSFDAGHQLLLMEHIRTKLQNGLNPNGLQFIVLTHEELLSDLFEHLQSNGGLVHHQIIEGTHPFNLTMRLKSPAQLRANALSYFQAGQVDSGKGWLRPYLECILMDIIRKLNIRVPYDFAVNDRQHMIKNCLEAIKSDVEMHKNANILVIDGTQEQNLKNIHLPALLANYVSHFETGNNSAVSAQVLISVLDSVDSFADCFKHDHTDPQTNLTTRIYYRSLSRI